MQLIMGNRWSKERSSNPAGFSPYKVILPTCCQAWEQVFNGSVDTWAAVAADYGMDKYAYSCGLASCDREAVCLKYIRATVKSDNQSIIIERYTKSALQVPIKNCDEIQTLLTAGLRLNEVVAAKRHNFIILVLHDARDFTTHTYFPLICLGSSGMAASRHSQNTKKRKIFRRSSSRKESIEVRQQTSSCSVNKNSTDSKRNISGLSCRKNRTESQKGDIALLVGEYHYPFKTNRPHLIGMLQAPQKDVTIISCHISPDMSQTAIMFYSMSRLFGMFCYTLHIYSNLGLQEDSTIESEAGLYASSPETCTRSASSSWEGEDESVEQPQTPHLVHTLRLSREVQPYFAYDPRYRNSRIAVANYECRDSGIAHELVVLHVSSRDDGSSTARRKTKEASMQEHMKDQEEGAEGCVRVVKRGKLSLPALFGNSRFNLLYSKDGELIILQKLTDDRFGVTSFCDIYVFHADDLTLIKYISAALPGLFHICKVSYEPVFSRCGSFMRLIDHRVTNNVSNNRRVRGASAEVGEDHDESENGMIVHIYQLPRALSLRSQCRRVILQNMLPCSYVDNLPLPQKLKDYLNFAPLY